MSEMKTFIIKNDQLDVHVLNYGATVDKIYCKDENGKMENVLLSYHKKEDYINFPGPYLNAIVGPIAGRIKDGKCNGREFTVNNGTNHLHGGIHGVSFDYWNIEQVSETKIICTHTKNHDEDGYKGTFNYKVTYSVEGDALVLEYDHSCDQLNPLGSTSHMYFNLSGDLKRGIYEHVLTSDITKMEMLDESGAPCCVETIEKGSCFDFTEGKVLGDALSVSHPQYDITGGGIDHPFLVNGPIKLEDPISKRVLEITTDQPCVVIYASNYIDNTTIFQNETIGYKHIALAIELQDYANAINLGLREESKEYKQKTSYRFYVKK